HRNAVDIGKPPRELRTVDDDAAAVMFFDAIDATNEGRLAGSGRPADDDFFPFADRKTHRIQGSERTESLHQTVDRNDRRPGGGVILVLPHDWRSVSACPLE